MVPCWRRFTRSAWERPNSSLYTSLLCWPSMGAVRRKVTKGIRASRNISPGTRRRPIIRMFDLGEVAPLL